MPAFARASSLTLFRAGLCLVTFAATGAFDVVGQDKPASLSGTWKYSAEKTSAERRGEAADPKTREGYNSGGRPRVGTGSTEPRGGGGGGGGRSGGSGGGAGTSGAGLGPVGVYVRALPEVAILQTDSTISVSDPSGQPHTYFLDGRKETVQMPGIEPIEIVAKWKGGKLTTERKFGALGSVREVYSLRADGKELMVEVRLTSPNLTQPMELKRVYDAPPKS